jgi:glutamine amidotransferase
VNPRIVILDYGTGNLRSAERALVRAGGEVTVTSDVNAAASADGLVVPGVGAFAACMAGIRAVGGDDVVRTRIAHGRPVLGICVGMQIMFTRGEEHGVVSDGIGVLDGAVTRLVADVVPHMGWSPVEPGAGSRLFSGVEGERFYFVHSYAAKTANVSTPTYAEHGERFVAAVETGALAATQFHPEKSGDTGAHLLKNWVSGL